MSLLVKALGKLNSANLAAGIAKPDPSPRDEASPLAPGLQSESVAEQTPVVERLPTVAEPTKAAQQRAVQDLAVNAATETLAADAVSEVAPAECDALAALKKLASESSTSESVTDGLDLLEDALRQLTPLSELQRLRSAPQRKSVEVRSEFTQLARQLQTLLHQPGPWCVTLIGPEGTGPDWLVPLAVAWLHETPRDSQKCRVLALDATGAGCGLSEAFDLTRVPGFEQFVTGQKSLDEVLSASPIQDLDVLAAGNPAGWIAELGTEKLRTQLQAMSESYALTLILASDSQPREAAALAAAGDGALLAINLRVTPQESAAAVKSALLQAGARLIGSLVRRF